jgi:hypothetical protein
MNLSQIKSDQNFLGLPEAEKAKVVETLGAKDPNFMALPDEEKVKVLNYFVKLGGNTKTSTDENKSVVAPVIEPSMMDGLGEKALNAAFPVKALAESVSQRVKDKTLLYPNEEDFVRKTIQGASSGPVMGAVQMVADATGNENISNKIAQNAKEGNFAGAMLQPEAWLTGGAAGKFIGQGGNWISKAARASLPAAAYGGSAVVANPSDSKLLDRATNAAISGTTALVASPVAELVTRSGQALVDAVRNRAGKVNAGKIARDVAGDKLDDIKAFNAGAPDNITSAQATLPANRDVWQSFGKLAQSKDQSSGYRMLNDAQEANRVASLEAVKPDLNTVTTQRTNITKPLYDKVRGGQQQVKTLPIASKIDDLLNKNSGNKPLVNALNEIKAGLYDDSGNLVTNPEKISSIMDGLKTSMASKDNKFILSTLTDIRSDIAKAIPGRVNADAQFSKLSKPVNQAKVIDAMVSTLKDPAGGERSARLVRILGDNENSLIKKADQSPRYGSVDEILNQQQKSAKDKVVNELIRDREVNSRAVEGVGGLADIIAGDKWRARLPPLIDTKFALANKALDVIETKVNKKTMAVIVEGMKNGKSANEMLNTLPSGERFKVIQALKTQKAIPFASGAMTSMQQGGE